MRIKIIETKRKYEMVLNEKEFMIIRKCIGGVDEEVFKRITRLEDKEWNMVLPMWKVMNGVTSDES